MHVEEKTDKLGTQNIEICSKSLQNIIGLLLVVGLLKRIFIDQKTKSMRFVVKH